MTATQSVLSRVVLAVGLGMAAASAQAVPIIFDFTGTVRHTYHNDWVNQTSGYDLSLAGQAVTGRIVVQVDGLRPRETTTASGTTVGYTDSILDPTELITSELNIAGVNYDVGAYSGDTGTVFAFDSSGLPPCEGCAVVRDLLAVTDSSREYWLPDGVVPPPGEYGARDLRINWIDGGTAPDFVNLSNGFEPLDIHQMLMGLIPSGSYEEAVWDCAGEECTVTSSSRTFFNINMMSVHTPSVPEPGTLALFAVGLLGGAVARRSKAKAR